MLTWKDIARITTAVVREQQPHLTVVAVTRAGIERVEVLIEGIDGPDRLMLNVTRAAPAHFEREFRDALSRAFPPVAAR
jgi:hypothetical protein